MNKDALMRQFFMRHMPNMLQGDRLENFNNYYNELRDATDENGYNPRHYIQTAYEFFETKLETPREMVSYIFGAGKNKFWCFEYNISDYPMEQFSTIYDIVVELENIQEKLVNEMEDSGGNYQKEFDNYNLWCCTSEPFQNIIINSVKADLLMENCYKSSDIVDKICNVRDDYAGQIMVDENNCFVDTAYHDDPIDELVLNDMRRKRFDIDRKYNDQLLALVEERFPNTIFHSITDKDVHVYSFAISDDIKKVSLENFFDDLNAFNHVEGSVEDLTIDGKKLFEHIENDLTEELQQLYHCLYAKHKADMDAGVAVMPKKKMTIDLSGIMDD